MGLREWIEQRWEKWQKSWGTAKWGENFFIKVFLFSCTCSFTRNYSDFLLFLSEFLIKISWKRRDMKIRMFLHHSIVSAEEYSKVPPSGHAATAAATIAYRVAEKTALQRGLSFSGWLVQACSTRDVALKFRKARPLLYFHLLTLYNFTSVSIHLHISSRAQDACTEVGRWALTIF